MKNNIKNLYDQVVDKKAFVRLLANEYGRTEDSIKTNWLSSLAIPDNYINRVHELLINTLKIQIRKTEKMIKK